MSSEADKIRIRREELEAAVARDAAEVAGVPLVPGSPLLQSVELAVEWADKVGYPVMLKSTAGGGGIGMQVCENQVSLEQAWDSVKRLSANYFSNDGVFLEKFVANARHIEVQVFGDGTDAVHLFERDCSLQRRHQKVIEEAPAPGMTDAVRAAMGAAAVKAAKAIGYAGAGTIEFIVDGGDGLRTDGFWFMEMNTRLQVEHPVTEAITGVDLVEWQLRVASGESLPAAQEDLTINGHSFEVRLYAEDVPAGFLPATGTLTHLQFPEGARSDSGVRTGDEISPWYDPMIAKIITHGGSRDIALGKMAQALAETQVAGSVTNLAFLRALVRHDDFAAGRVDTGLIDRDIDTLTPDPVPCIKARSLAALGFAGLAEENALETGFGLWARVPVTVQFSHKGEEIEARITTMTHRNFHIEMDGGFTTVTRTDGTWWVGGDKTPAEVVVFGDDVTVFWGNNYHFHGVDVLDVAHGAGGDPSLIEAPMPGLVKSVFVEAGAVVKEGDALAILEAMKMEHTLTAARDGVVAEVLCEAGGQVEAGAALIRLAEEDEAAA